MHRNNILKDRTLERLVNETAEEIGIKPDVVWAVYSHFYHFIYKQMTSTRLSNYIREKRKEYAKNITIPGFGRLLSTYGKTYKSKGVKENKKLPK